MSASNSTALAGEAKNSTTSTFLAALILNSAVFAAELVVFTVIRKRFKAIYEPRTFIPAESKRIPPLGDSLLGWPIAIFKADYKLIKHMNGMDAYVFIKFLRMMVRMFLPIWIISWAVLFPVTAVGEKVPGKAGLDIFTFGNVAADKQARYAAHIVLVYLFTGWIFWNINKEMREFITERQLYLVDAEHSATAQARTVLVTGVPAKFLSEKALMQLFSYLPGGVHKVWLNRDLKTLPDLYNRRLKASNKLESAETSLLGTAAKLRRKHLKAVAKGKAAPSAADDKAELTLSERLVPADKRPTHRLPAGFMPFSLPFIGQKVDTIEWSRTEIVETTQALDVGRNTLRQEINVAARTPGSAATNMKALHYPPLSSAFILFNQQIAAHLAAQTLTHNLPYRMADKYTEVAPADVIWANLGLNPYEARIRRLISYAATAGLIILWAIPVAFVGVISNIVGLCVKYKWLAWLCKIPSSVQGILQGILPPVLLAVLFILLPIVLRLFARFEGIPRRTGIELSLMTRFFIFLVVHGFLIVSLSSGIIKALPGLLANPSSAANLLAQNLPGASTFFITWAILQGLAGTASGFLQIGPLVVYYLKLYVLSSTPRSVYAVHYDLRDVAWGTLFPTVTLMTVIGLGYTIIAPVVNGFICVSFFLFYLMWKYLFLYQLDQPASGDTGGLFFPKAIQHTFVGLYVQQVCLCALFFLARNEKGKPSAAPEGVLMIILIVVTALYNIMINSSYGPLLHSLPLTLAHKSFGMPHSADTVDVVVGDDAEDGEAPDEEAAQREAEAQADGKGAHAQQAVAPRNGTGAAVASEGKHNDEPADFDHPAAVEGQRVVWIPRDTLGLGEQEEAACDAAGVSASTDRAHMNEKGQVEVDGHPPGEDSNMFSA